MLGKASQGLSRALVFALLVVLLASAVLTGSAAGDVGSSPWASSANDAALASMVSSPGASRLYQGTSGGSANLFSTAFAGSAGAISLRSAFVNAGIESLEFPNPWALVGSVLIGTAGAYIQYKAGSWLEHWTIDGGWAGPAGMSTWCGSMTATSSNCTGRYLAGGTRICLGLSSNGYSETATIPESGFYAWSSNVSGQPCAPSSWYLWAKASDATRIASIESALSVSGHTGTEISITSSNQYATDHYVMWMVPADPATHQPTAARADDIEPYTSQPTPSGDFTAHMGSPTITQIVTALRAELTGPDDTCFGSPCPWGALAPTQSDAATRQNVVDCLLTSCPSDRLSSSLTMPNCYGITLPDCESVLGDIGFTGTFDETPGGIDDADYTQPAGVVVSTVPAAGVAVSTAATAVVEATTNPSACKTQTDNPHWSEATNSMLAYVRITCTYTGTASYTASMWQCSGDPGPDGVNLATAGCRVERTTTRAATVTAGQETIAYCPWVSAGDGPVAWGSDYWIATSVTTEPDPVLNGPKSWSQGGWKAPPPP